MINIKPLKGKKVINPETSIAICEKGIFEQRVTQYWKNREKDGDVELIDMNKTNKKKGSK